jgi:hypothetical protein
VLVIFFPHCFGWASKDFWLIGVFCFWFHDYDLVLDRIWSFDVWLMCRAARFLNIVVYFD